MSLSAPDYLIVGDYRNRPSEGMQVVTLHVVDGLVDSGAHVEWCRTSEMWRRLAKVLVRPPATIVFTHGPGGGVLFWSGLLKRLTGACIVYLAPRSDIAGKPALLRRFAHVDFILASRLCPSLADVLTRCGGRYRREVHGIDLGRFALRSREENLGRRFQVFCEDRQPCGPVLLHVGHLRRNRGVERLISLKNGLGDSAEVVVLGSPTFPPDPSLVSELKGAGVVVRIGFFEDLHNCYHAADLFIFPGTEEEGGAVDLPLTVLEALACGTPVLSAPFGSLPDILADVPEIRFADAGSLLSECREFVRDPGRFPRRSRPLPKRYDLRSLSRRLTSFLAEDAAA